jgi:hypothetical protein
LEWEEEEEDKNNHLDWKERLEIQGNKIPNLIRRSEVRRVECVRERNPSSS